MKRILVTGATGFIGRHVRKRLNDNGYPILSLCRNSNKTEFQYPSEIIVEGNLGEPEVLMESLASYPIEACIHLAWEGIPDYSFENSQKNIMYGVNVLRLCRELSIPQLIVSGSCWEYKDPIGSIGESWPVDDSNHFKAAKNALRMISHAFCREQAIQFNWLRLFYVYGPGQREGSLIPYIEKELSHGRIPTLKGEGNRNDFIHVYDVAAAILQTLENRPKQEILNVGSGVSVSVTDVLRLLSESMGIKVPEVALGHIESEAAVDFYADIEMSCRFLDWKPEITLKEWLKERNSELLQSSGWIDQSLYENNLK